MKNSKIIIGLVAIAIIGIVLYFFPNNKQAETNINDQSDAAFFDDKNEIENGPQVEIEEPFYDFKIVKFGDVEKHIFKVNNVGNESLVILKLSTSCGCTKAYMQDDVKKIEPGKSADMVVTFDPAVHKDDSDLGELERVIYLVTNDLDNPEVEAEIRANVVKAENLRVIDIKASNWSFEPNSIEISSGEYVELIITSDDVKHGFKLPEFGIDEEVEPGKEISVKLFADKKGTFEFFCSVPCGKGHDSMRGELIIK